MKNYIKYLCAILLLIGVSLNMWAADPAAPSAHYTLIKDISSLSTNDRIILYCANDGSAVAGLSTCNSVTEARMSTTQSEWVEYKVTKGTGVITLQDTRISGTNSYVVNSDDHFAYGSSGSEFEVSSSGLLKSGTKFLRANTLGSGTCERASAKFYKNDGTNIYIFKVGYPDKYYYYNVTAASAELTVNADLSYGYYTTGKLATVHIDGSNFTGAIYAELIWPTWDVDEYKGYAMNSQSAGNGFIVAFKGSTYSPNNDEGVYVTIWNTVPDGTYNAQLHFYPKTGSTVTDPPYEYYIPVKIVVTNSASCEENPTFSTATSPQTTTSSLTSTSVIVNNIGLSSIGENCEIESYGYCWGTSEHPTLSDSYGQKGTSIGASSAFGNYSITGLTPNTTYYIRPYATNGNGTSYGPEVSITTLQQYTITYNKNDGGSTTTTQTKDHGINATLKAGGTFIRTGYTLTRWDTKSTGDGTSYALGGTYSGNADLTLYAVWTAKTYTINLDDRDATTAVDPTSVTATYNSSTIASITNPVKTGYTFGGWYTNSDGTGTLVISTGGALQASTSFTDGSGNWTSTSGTILYAKWTAKTLALTLDKGTDGTSDGSGSVTFDGTSATITSAATKTGDYTLLGYYAAADGDTKVLNPNGTFAGTNVTGYITSGHWSKDADTKLYAHWADVVYTVSFDLNGHGTDTPDDQPIVSGSYASAPTPVPTDVDYNFVGWYKEAGCENEWDFGSDAVTEDVTLYALWELKSYQKRIFSCVDISVGSADAGIALVTSRNGVKVMATNPIKVTVTGVLAGHPIAFSGTGLEFYKKVDGLYKNLSVAGNMLRGAQDAQEVYIAYNPTSDGDGSILTPTFTISCDGESQEFNSSGEFLKVRNLPASVAIVAKVGGTWHALPANISTSNPSPIMVSAAEVSGVLNAYGPSTVGYKLWSTSTVGSSNNRWGDNAAATVAYADRIRLAGNFNKALWANNSSTKNTISNGPATITATGDYFDNDAGYEWIVTTSEVDGEFVYTLQTDQGSNTNNLRLWGSKWGTYGSSNGIADVYILPLVATETADVTIMEWGTNSMAVKYANASTVASGTFKASINGAAKTDVSCASLGGDIYKLTNVGSLQGNPGKTLTLTMTETSTPKQAVFAIPLIVTEEKTEAQISSYAAGGDGSTKMTEGRAIAKGLDVIIRDGGKLTTGTASGAFADLYIYPGGKANITNDFNTSNIYMRGGYSFLNSPISGTYKYPDLFVDGATINTSGVTYDLFVDNRLYYTFSLPYTVSLSDVKDEAGNEDFPVWVKYYDGETRASGQQINGWAWYGDEIGQEDFFAGVGYEITAKPKISGRPLTIIRYPVKSGNITSDGGNAPKVDVGNWGYSAYTAGTQTANNVGWNLLGNPYLTEYKAATDTSLMVTGDLVHSDSDPWDGTYKWDTKPIRFITVPYDLATDYHHERVKDYAIPAFSAFFIQTTTAGKFTMGGTRTQAAVPIRRSLQQLMEPEVCVDLMLRGEGESVEGKAGLIIHEQYDGAYHDFEDVEQWFGSANLLKTYTIVGGTALAYNLLDQQTAETWVPVGYVANVGSKHTYALSEQNDLSRIEHVWLTDYEAGSTTDLLDRDYEFTTAAGRNDTRFAISIVFKQSGTTTDIDAVINDKGDETRKFIYHDKMYILHQGIIYDATGKKVMEINK